MFASTTPTYVEVATTAIVELVSSVSSIPTVAGIVGGLVGLTVLISAGCCILEERNLESVTTLKKGMSLMMDRSDLTISARCHAMNSQSQVAL